MATIGESALRRYGRATYDVTSRLAEVGGELYIRTRASLDDDEVCDVNDRLARGTYSHSLKSFPRRGPSSPRITVVIASPYPPYNDVTPRQMDAITSRLLKPTLVSRLRQTEPVQRSPPTSRSSSRSASTTPQLHPPGYVPPGILRLQSSSCGPSFPQGSRTDASNESNESKEDLDRSNPKVRFSIRKPVKTTQPSPYGLTRWRQSKENESKLNTSKDSTSKLNTSKDSTSKLNTSKDSTSKLNTSKDSTSKLNTSTSSSPDNKSKDIPEVVRSKSAPARAQRTLPEVDGPKALPRRERVRSNKKDTKPSPQRQKQPHKGPRGSKAYSSSSQVTRSSSSGAAPFNRLSFIATILEAEDEYDYGA